LAGTTVNKWWKLQKVSDGFINKVVVLACESVVDSQGPRAPGPPSVGELLPVRLSAKDEGVLVSASFCAPNVPGRSVSRWIIKDVNGWQLSDALTCVLQVVTSETDAADASSQHSIGSRSASMSPQRGHLAPTNASQVSEGASDSSDAAAVSSNLEENVDHSQVGASTPSQPSQQLSRRTVSMVEFETSIGEMNDLVESMRQSDSPAASIFPVNGQVGKRADFVVGGSGSSQRSSRSGRSQDADASDNSSVVVTDATVSSDGTADFATDGGDTEEEFMVIN